MIVKSDSCEGGSILYSNFEISEYQEYKTIWVQSFSRIISDKLGLNSKSTACKFDLNLPDETVLVYFYVGQYTWNFVRYPDTLLTALAKVGGIVAIFRISYFLRWLHKREYERHIVL